MCSVWFLIIYIKFQRKTPLINNIISCVNKEKIYKNLVSLSKRLAINLPYEQYAIMKHLLEQPNQGTLEALKIIYLIT